MINESSATPNFTDVYENSLLKLLGKKALGI